MLKSSILNTPLGPLVAIASEKELHHLEFEDTKKLKKLDAKEGFTSIHAHLKQELKEYFSGNLKTFSVPLFLSGSYFQKQVWTALQEIPYGHTWSYQELAIYMGKPTSSRAVARGNSTNSIAILIPCHRVIRSDQTLGGYNGGITRKKQLLNLESTSCKQKFISY